MHQIPVYLKEETGEQVNAFLEITGGVNVLHITIEPGDHTRYSFLVAREGHNFYIAPWRSELPYPQRLDEFIMSRIELGPSPCEKMCEIAEQYKCNPWTVRAVVIALKNWAKL